MLCKVLLIGLPMDDLIHAKKGGFYGTNGPNFHLFLSFLSSGTSPNDTNTRKLQVCCTRAERRIRDVKEKNLYRQLVSEASLPDNKQREGLTYTRGDATAPWPSCRAYPRYDIETGGNNGSDSQLI